MVPKGWKKLSLSSVAEVRTGIAKGKNDLKNPVVLPYLRVANVQDGYIDISDIKSIQVEQDRIDRYSLKAGDVLMTEGGDFDKLGRGDVWNGEIIPCLHQNHVFCVRTDQASLLPHFLAALSASRYGKAYFLGCAKKSTNLASINSTQLKEFPVLIPPLSEQKKITKILSTWDQVIKNIDKVLANNQQQKRVLMQQLLTGKNRLPGFSEKKWTNYRLGKLFNERVEKNRVDLPLVSITRNQGVIWRDEVGRKDTSSEDKTKYLRICPGDIGYNTMRMWQGVSALSAIEGVVSPAYTIVTPKEGVDGLFMSYLFKLPRTIHNFYRYSQGLTSDTWNLKFRHFKEVTVTIPILEEQKQIAKILQACDQEIDALIKMRDSLVTEKKALMQQLLTGKRRVKVDAA